MNFWNNQQKMVMERNWELKTFLGQAWRYMLWITGQIVIMVVCRIGLSELLSVVMYSERYVIPVSDSALVFCGLISLYLIVWWKIGDSWRTKKVIWQQRLRRAKIVMIMLVMVTLWTTTWGSHALPEVLGLEISIVTFLVIWPQTFVMWTQWFWPRVLGVCSCAECEVI